MTKKFPERTLPSTLASHWIKKKNSNGLSTSKTETCASRRLSLMKKLAGTKWGADRRILRQVYTGNVRPVMEYGAAVWATAAKTNTERLDRVQNAGLRIITGGLK